MTIIVTGSSGFIGGRLVQYLRSLGHKTFGVDIAPAVTTDLLCDIRDYDSLYPQLKHIDCYALVHLAARTDLLGRTILDYSTNTLGTYNICNIVRTLQIPRSIFASSQLVHPLSHPCGNLYALMPDTFYGQSKVLSEHIIKSALDVTSQRYIILRPTTVWGPGCSQHYQNFLSKLLHHNYIHPTTKPVLKSFSYIGNAVYQIERLISLHNFPQSFTSYLCDYTPIEIYDWISRLSLQLGSKPPGRISSKIANIAILPLDYLSSRFPSLPISNLTIRRLNNILTPYYYDVSDLHSLVTSLPYDLNQGVKCTAQWFLACFQNLPSDGNPPHIPSLQ
jgi:nucleoside-diphosphate-sugar epimerase